jgi:hypothetical protein
MNIRKSALGGAAIAALALYGTAFAEDATTTKNSTPAEKAQTQDLNTGAQQGAMSDAAASDAAQLDYQAKLQTFEQQQNTYQQQRAHYDNEKARYDANRAVWRHRYDTAHWGARSYYGVRYEDSHLVRLSTLADPQYQLAFALVVGREGNWIGKINDVDSNWGGHPERVQIAISDTKAVWVDPKELRYDLDEHVVVTNLTRDQLRAMPNSRVQSSSAY